MRAVSDNPPAEPLRANVAGPAEPALGRAAEPPPAPLAPAPPPPPPPCDDLGLRSRMRAWSARTARSRSREAGLESPRALDEAFCGSFKTCDSRPVIQVLSFKSCDSSPVIQDLLFKSCDSTHSTAGFGVPADAIARRIQLKLRLRQLPLGGASGQGLGFGPGPGLGAQLPLVLHAHLRGAHLAVFGEGPPLKLSPTAAQCLHVHPCPCRHVNPPHIASRRGEVGIVTSRWWAVLVFGGVEGGCLAEVGITWPRAVARSASEGCRLRPRRRSRAASAFATAAGSGPAAAAAW